MTQRTLQIAIYIILLCCCAVTTYAAPPRTINYQGYLTDGTNVPVTSAAKTMSFALYSTATGGSPLWNESQEVKIEKGIYSVELGQSSALNLPFDTRYYLGITIPPDEEMSPRIALTSSPYALKAGCNPGDMITCYTGPASTLNIGVCKSGIRTCAGDGSSFGPCAGEIVPLQEICYNADDEDCDGVIDNGCTPRACEPNSTRSCYSGPVGTMINGVCRSGLQTCNAEGSAYGACTGEQLPIAETCDNQDNDCNGLIDDNISSAPVANGQYVCFNGSTTLFCNSGYASCISSGCETSILNDTQNCGGCGNICPAVSNGTSTCNNSSCIIATCNAGFGNCDMNPANGCETNLSISAAHCGACGYACGANESCQNGMCIKPLGSACSSNNQCASGFCTDGVCCSTACTGTCQACNIPGLLGSCTMLPSGTDPGNECTDQGAASCGTTGMCDGAGACSYYASGTQASTGNCTAGISTLPNTCNGSGTALTGGTQICSPYVCGSSACKTFCSIPADCASGYTCSGGVCKKATGQTCGTNTECATGFCADGFCCESACTGTCEKCSQLGRQGYCDPIAAGTDPDNECAGAIMCDGARACQP